ncbi:MAG TPA: family 10 glycosylhydrolase, partial [Candidatus Eisenbacteria bacterium]|nr:family 10 glycosylhydrolase [Candidatus Eisenbacteria bacterium]
SERPGLAHLAAGHPARRNPAWVVEYGGQLWYDPGNPAVRALAVEVIGDVARRYRVDGIHLDDYFYPYPVPGEAFADHVTFRRYGTGFGSRAQWRRHNINLLVAEVCAEVRRVRPWAKFGVSPFGIWRNASSDPEGSPTAGLQAYDDLYADSRAWIRRGWLDYVAPQLYWEIGNRAAPYEKLVRWWSRTVSQTSTELYIGQAAYLGQTWHDPAEMSRHLAFDRRQQQVSGELFFHARSLGSRFGARLAGEDFAGPAYPPLPPRIRRLLSMPTTAPTKAAAKKAAEAPGLPPSGWLRREAIINCPHRQL